LTKPFRWGSSRANRGQIEQLGSGDGFAEALGKFGGLYADQTEKDWQQLRRSRKAGTKSKALAKS
jgi:hypothetical protein